MQTELSTKETNQKVGRNMFSQMERVD